MTIVDSSRYTSMFCFIQFYQNLILYNRKILAAVSTVRAIKGNYENAMG